MSGCSCVFIIVDRGKADPLLHRAQRLGVSRVTGAPYVCLMTVLDRGLGPECMRVARQAGTRGDTILHAHGAGARGQHGGGTAARNTRGQLKKQAVCQSAENLEKFSAF